MAAPLIALNADPAWSFLPRTQLAGTTAGPAGTVVVCSDDASLRAIVVDATTRRQHLTPWSILPMRRTSVDLTGAEGMLVQDSGFGGSWALVGANAAGVAVVSRVFTYGAIQVAEAIFSFVGAFCVAKAGAACAVNDPLRSDATSRLVPATVPGDIISAFALSAAAAPGDDVLVQLTIGQL